jgi:hypothetical protein
MRRAAFGLGIALVFAVEPVRAAPAPAIDLGVRLGFATAGGEAVAGDAMSNHVASAITFGFDAHYRFDPHLAVGLYVLPAFGLRAPGGCPSDASCSSGGGQVGVEGKYRLLDESSDFIPWVSAGLGLDVLQHKETVTTTTSGIVFQGQRRDERETFAYGPELMVQAGADARLSRSFTLGGWAGLAISQYWGTKYRARVNGDDVDSSSGSVDEKAVHTWLFFGVRGAFEIALRG